MAAGLINRSNDVTLTTSHFILTPAFLIWTLAGLDAAFEEESCITSEVASYVAPFPEREAHERIRSPPFSWTPHP